jgi:hypothetical protein
VRILRRLVHDVPADLLAVPAVVLLATAVVWVSDSPLRAIAGGVILLACGYVLARILIRGPSSLDDAGVWLVALAIAATAVTGLVLDLLPAGLTERTWLVALDVLTTATVVLLGRRSPKLALHVPRLRRPGLGAYIGALCLLLAAALTATALTVGMSGAEAQERKQPFTALWLLPQSSGKVAIGVRSGRSGRTAYRIVLRDEHRVLHTWRGVSLDFGEQWQDVVSPPRSVRAGRLLRAEVFAGDGRRSLESVRVRWPG